MFHTRTINFILVSRGRESAATAQRISFRHESGLCNIDSIYFSHKRGKKVLEIIYVIISFSSELEHSLVWLADCGMSTCLYRCFVCSLAHRSIPGWFLFLTFSSYFHVYLRFLLAGYILRVTWPVHHVEGKESLSLPWHDPYDPIVPHMYIYFFCNSTGELIADWEECQVSDVRLSSGHISTAVSVYTFLSGFSISAIVSIS